MTLFDQHPWASYNADGRPGGYLVDLTQQLVVRTGLPLTIRLGTGQRIAEDFLSGTADLSFLPESTLAPIRAVPLGTVYRGNLIAIGAEGVRLARYEDLKALAPIGSLRGITYGSLLDKDPTIPRSPEQTIEGALRKMAAGRLKVFAGTELAISGAALQAQMPLHRMPVIPLGKWSLVLAGTVEMAADPAAEALSEAIESLVLDGTADRLAHQYQHNLPPP